MDELGQPGVRGIWLVPGIHILFPMLLMRMLASWVASLVWCWHVLCLLSLTPRKNLHTCRCVSWQLSSWGLVCCWKASCKSFLNSDRINWIPEHVLRKNNLETDLLCGIFYLQWTLSRSKHLRTRSSRKSGGRLACRCGCPASHLTITVLCGGFPQRLEPHYGGTGNHTEQLCFPQRMYRSD